MTNEHVILQILAEITGKPEVTFKPALDAVRAMSPNNRLDVELSPDEAQRLLTQLRAEKTGILKWLIEGR